MQTLASGIPTVNPTMGPTTPVRRPRLRKVKIVKLNPAGGARKRCKENAGQALTRKTNNIYEVVRWLFTRVGGGGVPPSGPVCGSCTTGIADDTLSTRPSSTLYFQSSTATTSCT